MTIYDTIIKNGIYLLNEWLNLFKIFNKNSGVHYTIHLLKREILDYKTLFNKTF